MLENKQIIWDHIVFSVFENRTTIGKYVLQDSIKGQVDMTKGLPRVSFFHYPAFSHICIKLSLAFVIRPC